MKCYFIGDNNPFPPQEMSPPPIGSLMFIEIEKPVWKVTGIQYQYTMKRELLLINVILERFDV